MGGLLHLVQREGDWRGHRPPRPLFAVPNVTAHPSTASVPTSYYSMWYYRQACTKRSHAGIVFTQWSKNGFFAPQWRHIAPINVKFGTGSRPSLRRAKFHVYRGRNVRIQPPKLSKSRILAINLPIRGDALH